MRAAVFACVLLCGLVQNPSPAKLDESIGAVQDAAPPATVDVPAHPAPGTWIFSFTPRASDALPWEIGIGPDRSGWFREPPGEAQPIRVSEALWKRVSLAMGAVRTGNCETRQKGIAQTGVKTISLVQEPKPMSCTFNFSDVEVLNEAANHFLALAETMKEGEKLQHDRRFDRLALDADIDALVDAVEGGRALEPRNIAPVLQAIAEDDRVIERVRRKAARLLQDAAAADKPR